jgi:NAD(P)-dependent dehydrogenase (short-subunit alcohol dehydrogenase family)
MGKLEGKVALVSGRTGTAEEIVKAVVFLASDDSSFVNAAELVVDAGMSLV